MRPSSFTGAIKVFQENSRLLTTKQAENLGVDRKTLTRMLRARILVKEARGLYRLASYPIETYPDLVQVASRIPSAIICLISALAFHDLTDSIPNRVYIALPKYTSTPRLDYPPLAIVRVSEKAYKAGIEIHQLDGTPVKIYSTAKTVADSFKFRNRVGDDVALEALRNYLRRPDANIEDLLNCARIDRVEKIMLPYIRASL